MKVFVSLLTAVVCLLLAPAAALAENYVVNDIGDEADVAVGSGGCDADAGAPVKCTLRAAIQESNASTSADDTITFAALFNGEVADTISAGAGFPAITDKVTIDGDAGGAGGQCTTAAAGVKGPCAGVARTVAGSVLVVENTDDVTIEGLALTNATGPGAAAINVLNSSASFDARDNWLGVKLDGSAGANEKGVFLDPDSNGATIGGTAAADRNVFANNAFEGLDVEGADNADVLGNYFGVKPDGATQAANGKDIEITDTVAFEATGNEVGATISGAAAPCDGACNVISGATFAGVDLQGNGGNEEPASGPTTIHGNYIGLGAAGSAVIANGTYGIYSGAAKAVTIGGEENGNANYFAGGGTGIYHQDGEELAVLGNVFGSATTGGEITPPGLGVFVYCLNLGGAGADPVIVEDNVFEMAGGTGVESNAASTPAATRRGRAT